MSVIAEIIDTLENKIEKLFTKINSLEKKSQDLTIELTKSATIIQAQAQEIDVLKKQYEIISSSKSIQRNFLI